MTGTCKTVTNFRHFPEGDGLKKSQKKGKHSIYIFKKGRKDNPGNYKGVYLYSGKSGVFFSSRKKMFIVRMVRRWTRFPREVVDKPFLGVFKARLEGALSNPL